MSLAPEDYDEIQSLLLANSLMLADPGGQMKLLYPGNGGRVFAVNGGRSASVAVRTVERGGATDVSQVPGPSIDEPRKRAVPGMTYERSSLGGRTAIKVTFVGEGTNETRYYLLENGREFHVTLSGTSPDLAKIAESIRFR